MSKKRAPKKPAFSKYDQWVEAGKPYWTGVSLANAVSGYPVLKRTLNITKSPWNQSKLDSFLALNYAYIPAETLSAEDLETINTQEQAPVATAPRNGTATKAMGTAPAVAVANKVSAPAPEQPKIYSESSFALPRFDELPDSLKKARIENIERRRRAEALHDRLAEGIADPFECSDVCAEIVELMDMVWSSYDVERDWKVNGITPDLPEDTLDQLRKLDLFALQEAVTNRLRPRVSRWRGATKLRDGDALVEAKMNLANAENNLALALQVITEKKAKHQLQVDALEHERQQRKTTLRK